MITYYRSFLGAVIAPLLLTACANSTAAEFDVRAPRLDSKGRFWIYGSSVQDRMPFVPYGWMPLGADKMMTLDTDSMKSPHREEGEREGEGACMEVTIAWKAPYWSGVAFLSGPDAPQWWCEDRRGWYYDLRLLKHRRLVFFARGETGDERIQIKLGITGDKRFGDSLSFPAETPWLRLTTQWKQFELDLSTLKPAELARICNGFTFVASRDQQEGSARYTRFWLDTIYLE